MTTKDVLGLKVVALGKQYLPQLVDVHLTGVWHNVEKYLAGIEKNKRL